MGYILIKLSINHDSLLLSFSIVDFCSLSTFWRLSNSNVNLNLKSQLPLKQQSFFVDQGFELLLSLSAVVLLAFNFVARTHRL